MPARATYSKSKSSFTRGIRATDVWTVSGALNFLDAQQAVPKQQGNSHDQDASIFVHYPPSVTHVGGDTYEVTAQYDPFGGGSPIDPDPLKRPMKWHWEDMTTTEAVTYDYFGNPVTNVFGDPIDGVTEEHDELVLVGTRYVAEFPTRTAMSYRKSINGDAVTIPKIGKFEPGELLLMSYKTPDEFDKNTKYVQEVFRLWARPGDDVTITSKSGVSVTMKDGHVRKLLNTGTRGAYSTATTPFVAKLFDKDTNAATEPILLNRDGTPIDIDSWKVGRGRETPVAHVAPYFASGDASLVKVINGASGKPAATFVKYLLKDVKYFAPLNLDK